VKLDQKDLKAAVEMAYQSMIHSAEAVIRNGNREFVGTPETTVAEFKKTYFDTGEFVKHVNNTQFAAYLFKAHANASSGKAPSAEDAHRQVEEAQLFMEAVHSYMANATLVAVPGK